MNYFEEYLKIENITPDFRKECESILNRIRSGELIYPEKKIDQFIKSKKAFDVISEAYACVVYYDS